MGSRLLRAGRAARLAALAAVPCACGAGTDAPAADAAPPPDRLVLIVVDTLRADLGSAQAGPVEAPRIARLAEQGVRFEQAFAHAPSTVPSHAALFASRLPHECGVVANGQRLRPELPLLAEHLRDLGWQTLAVISLGSVLTGDLRRGFEVFGPAADQFIVEGSRVRERLAEVIAGIDPERPFFLFAHFSDPHEPYNTHEASETAELRLDGGPPETLTTAAMTHWRKQLELAPGEHRLALASDEDMRLRSIAIETEAGELEPRFVTGALKLPTRAIELAFDVPADAGPCRIALWLTDHPEREEIPGRYRDEVEFVDSQVGLLLDELAARGLDRRCVTVLTSDHGESLGERRFIGHTRSLHDELLHVPLVIRPPAGFARADDLRAHAGELVGLMDVTPTVLDMLGLPPLEGQRGRSLLTREPARPIVAQASLPERPGGRVALDLIALRDERSKLVYFAHEDRFELFDLTADPGEQHDVHAASGRDLASWEEALRSMARAALDVDPELQEDALDALRALGYVK